jgi:hypothetical protein
MQNANPKSGQFKNGVPHDDNSIAAKFSTRLRDWDTRLEMIQDLLRVESKRLDTYSRVEFESEIAALWLKRQRIYSAIRNLRTSENLDQEDAKNDIGYLWDDLASATDTLLARLNHQHSEEFGESS